LKIDHRLLHQSCPLLEADEKNGQADPAESFVERDKVYAPGHVRIAAAVASNGGLSLGVHDTGIGIASADLPRLMQPFVQVDGTLTRKYDGTGLGLALVKSMVELQRAAMSRLRASWTKAPR